MTPREIIATLDGLLSKPLPYETEQALKAAKRYIVTVERLANEVNVVSKGEYIAVNEVREILFREVKEGEAK